MRGIERHEVHGLGLAIRLRDDEHLRVVGPDLCLNQVTVPAVPTVRLLRSGTRSRCVPKPGRRLMGIRTRPAGGNTRDLWLGFGRVCSNLQVTGPVSCRPRQVKDSIRLFACPASTDASLAPASAVSAPGAGRALRPRRGSSSAASRRGAHGTRHDPRSAPPPRPAR